MNEQDIFEVRQTDVEIQEIFDQVPKNKKAIEDINGKLPAEASPENPLADKEYVDGRVGAERTRAEGAENNLQQAINTEASRAAEAERVLDGKIAAEEARAEGAEQTLDGKIATEKTRAEGVESTLDGKIAAEKARAEGAEQTLDGKIATEKTRAEGVESTLDGKITAEKTRAEGVETTLQGGINSINGKIPTQASSQNQLADKEFVNSTVGTNTANYISNNGQPFTSLAELQAYTGPHDNNDYAFVKTLDALGNVIYHRYKYSDASRKWALEYTLNNSSFTAAQWAAINSTITSGMVEKLNALPTKEQLDTLFSGKQDTISDLATIRSGAAAGATALQPAALTPYYTKSETDNLLGQKQAAITDGAQIGLGFGVSSEASTVQARTAAIPSFILLKNMPVSIRFTNSINVDGATLNISSTGAKLLFIQGAALQAGLVKGGCTVTVIYDGTNWNIVGIEGLERPASQSDLFVDMGLPSGRLWAIANIDVTKQSGFAEVDGKPSPFIYEGTFFSWGNTEGHNPTSTSAFDYDWGTDNDGTYAQTPGAQLTANAGLSFDAARAILGAPWRDPSTEDFAELFANIDYVQADGETVIDASQANKLVTVNGIVGIYLKSKINGRLLFFPCSGYGYGQSWYSRGSDGYYWSRSLHSQAGGRNLLFYSGGVFPQYNYSRVYGFSRRAVQ